MRLRRTRPRTTRTMVGITTIHGVTMPRRTSVRRKTRAKKVRPIWVMAFSEFVPARRVVQRETAPTACMRRGCKVCKKKNRSRTYVPR